MTRKLEQYRIQTVAWYHMLKPVVYQFVFAFDDPNGWPNIDFWQKVAHYEESGGGPRWITAWITAFCAWDSKGNWLGNHFIDVRGPMVIDWDWDSLSCRNRGQRETQNLCLLAHSQQHIS